MLTVYKASAGSGKTFTLTREYIHLLFENENNYRQTLAVTFTNKACGEMKQRIIEDLYKLSTGASSPYVKELEQTFNLNAFQVQQKAERILHLILHNYSFFFVETIDSFFQRITQNFTRELGIQAGFHVELDNNKVLEQVVDILLLELEQKPEVKEWLKRFASDKIENDQNFNIKKDIFKIGKEIFNEEFYARALKLKVLTDNKSKAESYFKAILEIKNNFEKKLQSFAVKALEIIKNNNLSVADFSYGVKGFANTFNKLISGDFSRPSSRFYDAFNNIDKWYSKSSKNIVAIESVYHSVLNDIVGEILNVFETENNLYKSALAVYDFRYSLALLSDIAERILRFCEDENIFLLSANSRLIHEIIKENDTPFIYEKIGSTIKNYMIDEFQDTSKLQWENFKPLVENSIAEGGTALLVGDVKQSIYRWRNGDWTILGEQVPKEFENRADIKNLETNWRSASRIVRFNNTFFSIAAQAIQHDFNSVAENVDSDFSSEYSQKLINAYDAIEQALPDGKKDSGSVKISFIDEKKSDLYEESVFNELPGIIEQLQYDGYKPSEIAFLVRRAVEAEKLVSFFSNYKLSNEAKKDISYDIFSAEAVKLENSQAISFIIALLQLRQSYDNDVAKAFIVYYIKTVIKKQEIGFLSFNIDNFDNFWDELHTKITYASSLFSFVEQCILFCELNKQTHEIPFIVAFQDILNDFEVKQSSNLALFLDFWEEKKSRLYIPLTENESAMNVLTIHKSKGLEFKVVIMPWASWDWKKGVGEVLWCKPDVAPFNELEVLPVKMNDGLAESVFFKDYYVEMFHKRVDLLNLYYVAFTRAVEQLFVFIPKNGKTNYSGFYVEEVLNKSSHYSNTLTYGMPINQYIDDTGFSYGIPTVPVVADKVNESIIVEEYPVSKPITSIMPLSRNTDFFEDFSGHGKRKSYGVLMHKLFEQIQTKQDVPKAIESFRQIGEITNENKLTLQQMFDGLLSEQPFSRWFSGEYKVLNERSLIIPQLETKRPDRIMIKDDVAIVVDYKFTIEKKSEHLDQVQEYKNILSAMNYSTSAYVWYIERGELVEV